MADEIIEELWKIKDAIALEYGYDIDALVAHLRAVTPPASRVVDLHRARIAESGRRECLAPAPHTTGHAGPHQAVPRRGARRT